MRKLNVDGDGQGDLAGHGGEQRAVFVYQLDSYRYWERELGRTTSPRPAFVIARVSRRRRWATCSARMAPMSSRW